MWTTIVAVLVVVGIIGSCIRGVLDAPGLPKRDCRVELVVRQDIKESNR